MSGWKDNVKRVGGYGSSDDGSYTVFDSRNPNFGSKKQDLGTSEGAAASAKALNQLANNSQIIKKDMGIWRGVNPGYAANTHGQQAVQGLMDLKNMKNGADVIVYDTEILGTTPFNRKDKNNLDFYTPTEIGFQHTKMTNGQLQPTGKELSILLRPNEHTFQRLNSLINDVSNGKWVGMTDDVRRTLSDLTLYGGDPSQLFKEEYKDGRRIASVNQQNRERHPLKGSVLTSSDNISMMRQGLENLMKWGTRPEDAIVEMNAFTKTMSEVRYAGYNVYNFDQPMMIDYLNNQVGKHASNSKAGIALKRLKADMALNQIDGLHAVRTLYRDNYSTYGENVTLETMKKVFGIDTGQSHHALSDAGVTTAQLNKLLADEGLAKTLTSGGKAGTKFGRFDSSSVQVGDRFLGVAGMNSKDAGEFDGVYRMKNNKLVPAYDMKTNPIYRNATYKVNKFIDGLEIGGKKMFGVQLYNESDDLYHTIYRSTKSDLQNAIHGHLEYIERPTSESSVAARLQNQDRGRRRWDKMFSTESGGGLGLANRMLQALDVAREGEKQGLGWDVIQQNIVNASEWNTDEFVRDFKTIRGRLEGEEKWIRGFSERIQNSPLKGDSAYTNRVQNMAFSEFGKLMQDEFGKNEIHRPLPNGLQAIELKGDEGSRYLNLNNPDGVRGGLYGHLYQGHTGRPNMGILKKRYRDLLMQLKAHNALDAKKFEQMYKALDGTRHDMSIDNILNELSNSLMQARETNSLRGALRHIPVEDATQVRRAGVKSAETFNEKFEQLATKAINGISSYQTLWDGDGPMPISGSPALDLLNQHDDAVQQILKRNGIDERTGVSLANVRSSRSTLTKMAEAYMKQGMNVQLRYDGKRKGLMMVLADKDVSDAVLNGSIASLRGDNKNRVAVIDLPRINADGTMTMGGQNRVARLKSKRTNSGMELVTGFDEIVNTLTHNASTAKKMLDSSKRAGEKNGILQVGSYLSSRSRKAMQNLSMNNRYGNPSDAESMFEVKSKAANWVRGGAIDISDYAEDWYREWYMNQPDERKKLWGLKSADEIAEKARDGKELFANTMGVNARRVFQRQSDDYIRKMTGGGLDLGMHSVKDTHVSNYLRSNLDARELLPFGFFNPMARENIMKTVNYMALDRQRVADQLGGSYSDTEIQRILNRGVITDKAKEVLENEADGKVAYLNMRAGYMDDKTLSTRLGELRQEYHNKAFGENKDPDAKVRWEYKKLHKRLENLENISTYDGMMLMSEEAGKAFETTREKKYSLSTDATLTKDMQSLMRQAAQQSGVEFDLTKTMNFSSGPSLGSGNGKKFTVSELVKQEVMYDSDGSMVFNEDGSPKMAPPVRTNDQVHDKWNPNIRVKGWNAEDQTVILEERVMSANATKAITDGGGRLTMTMLPDQIIQDLAGVKEGQARVQAIMPAFEAGKGMYGTELNKFVSLAVDEALAQINGDSQGKLTAGDLKTQEVLRHISNLATQTFNIDNKLIKVEGSQLVLDKRLGTDGKAMDYKYSNVSKFLGQVDEYLGTNFRSGDGKVALGQVGIGRQDIHDWENGVGFVEGSKEGLVKYGRKEIDMVTARANEVLGTRGSAVVGWLSSHITSAAEAQNKNIRQIATGLIRTVVDPNGNTMDAGDVVIRTTGTSFGGDDPMGKTTGRTTSKGVREISMHALNDLPQITAADMKLTSDSYAQSIVDFGRVKGNFEDGTSFGEAIQKNGGTALLEMPDDNGFSRKYLRLVDFGDVSATNNGDIPTLREIQKTQQQIWRNIKEYQSVGSNGEMDLGAREEELSRLRGKINTLSDDYEDKAARMTTNARDNGIMKSIGSAKMDMSGRFRIQGVNPFENYEKVNGEWQQKAESKYKEGTLYVSRDRLGEMIGGKENEIAKTLGINVDGMSDTRLRKEVLDNINEKGLYGIVNRYPTIKQSTMQSMRIEIDDTMGADDRSARFTVGTAIRMKADYDGDFVSAMLAHYQTENAADIHNELKQIHGKEGIGEQALSLQQGSKTLAELEQELTGTAKQMNVTVGQLAKEATASARILSQGGTLNKRQQKMHDLFNNALENTSSWKDAIETREARLGKEFVGFIDNTRDKVLNLATSTLEALESKGKMSRNRVLDYRNSIEDFTAKFSQDLISSKKFNINDELTRQKELDKNASDSIIEQRARETLDRRYEKLQDMNEAILNPTEKNLDIFRSANEEIQLYDEKDAKQMNSALSAIQDMARLTPGGFQNKSLSMSVSEGQGMNVAQQFISGQGDMIVKTQATKLLAENAPQEIRERLESKMANWERTILSNFDNFDNSESLIDSLGTKGFNPNDHVLSGATVAEEASTKLGSVVGKFTAKMPSMGGGGVAGGAIAFGAMWAASAFMRSGPTPEGLREQTQQNAPPPPPKSVMQTPTARVTQNNGEHVNIRVSAKDAQSMSQEDIAALVHSELGAMTSMNLNTTMNVNDNTQNIDQQWLQGVVANAIDKGFGF